MSAIAGPDHSRRPLLSRWSRLRGTPVVLVAIGLLASRCDSCDENDTGAVTMTPDSTPVCSDQQLARWRAVHDNSLGAAGRDPVGAVIGAFVAADKYHPIDVVKQTLCGRLHHFNFYDAWGSGDEADWNNHIIPSPAFSFILDDARAAAGDIHDCDGKDDCLEAEITPDDAYEDSPYFPSSTGVSPLEGSTLCTYGPWVGDGGHDLRPEIHPSELFWWRSTQSVLRLLVVQEDSNRFDRQSNYNVGNSPPAGWRPWSAFPRSAEFKIAFEVKPGATKRNIVVAEEDERNVVTADDPVASADVTEGLVHGIKYDGHMVLSVVEGVPDTRRLGVQFADVCRSAANDRVQGFVVVTTKVGKGDRGDEGYHLLRVDDREQVIEEPPTRPPRASVEVVTVPGTLARPDCKIPRLAIDVQATVRSTPLASADDLVIAKVELVTKGGREPVNFQLVGPMAGAAMAKIGAVPLVADATLSFTMKSGLVVDSVVPSLALTPKVTRSEVAGALEPGAWKSLIAVVGGGGGPSLPAELTRLKSAAVALAPLYAPRRDGAASLDDDSPIAEELNEALAKGDPKRLQDLYCTAQPFQVTWSFQATNLTSGAPASARKDTVGKPSEYLYGLAAGALPDGNLAVTLPSDPPSEIGHLVASARITDALGNVATVDVEVATHVLAGADESKLAEQLLPAIAEMGGANAAALVAASALQPVSDKAPLADDPASRRARVVRLATMQAAADRSVSLDELRRLVVAAKRFTAK